MTKNPKVDGLKTHSRMSAYQKLHATAPSKETPSQLPNTNTRLEATKMSSAEIKCETSSILPTSTKNGFTTLSTNSKDIDAPLKSRKKNDSVDYGFGTDGEGVSDSQSEDSMKSANITGKLYKDNISNFNRSDGKKRAHEVSSGESSEDEDDSSSEEEGGPSDETDSEGEDEEILNPEHEFNPGSTSNEIDDSTSSLHSFHRTPSTSPSISESSIKSRAAMLRTTDAEIANTEDSDSSSVEETIMSWGARSALEEASDSRDSSSSLSENDGDLIEDDGMVADDESSVCEACDQEDSVQGYPRNILARSTSPSESSESTVTLNALPTSTEHRPAAKVTVPFWFPENIKMIFEVDHRGGALTFKELNAITHYRALLEITRRRKWKRYMQAGQARWKLQKIMHKMRVRPSSTTKKFYAFRKKQYGYWKAEALRRWKRLEKYQRGVLVLDEVINTNFSMERVIYRKKLN